MQKKVQALGDGEEQENEVWVPEKCRSKIYAVSEVATPILETEYSPILNETQFLSLEPASWSRSSIGRVIFLSIRWDGKFAAGPQDSFNVYFKLLWTRCRP